MRTKASAVLPHFVVSRPRCVSSCPDRSELCAFQVKWAINPHMRVGAVRPRRAVSEHRAFVDTLRGLGATVHSVPFVHGAFDSVFSKDNAVIVRRAHGAVDALLARPKVSSSCARRRSRPRGGARSRRIRPSAS